MKQREFLKWAERVNAKINHGTRRFDFRWNWDEEYAKGRSWICEGCGYELCGRPWTIKGYTKSGNDGQHASVTAIQRTNFLSASPRRGYLGEPVPD